MSSFLFEYKQKALKPRLFIIPFVQGVLVFYEQSYTLDVMRLRKKIHRLDFLQFVAQFLIEFDIPRHSGNITGDIGDAVSSCLGACFDEAVGQALAWWVNQNSGWSDAFLEPILHSIFSRVTDIVGIGDTVQFCVLLAVFYCFWDDFYSINFLDMLSD